MAETIVKLGPPSDDDRGGFNNPLFEEGLPAGKVTFCEIKAQTTWRKEQWARTMLNEDQYGFKPIQYNSLVADIPTAKTIVNEMFAYFINVYMGGALPVWIGKSYTNEDYIECQIPITFDRHMKIKVRIYSKSVQYDKNGNIVIGGLRSL